MQKITKKTYWAQQDLNQNEQWNPNQISYSICCFGVDKLLQPGFAFSDPASSYFKKSFIFL